MIKGLVEQKIIQGKTYHLGLKFASADIEKISKMWFSCAELNIIREMELDQETSIYSLELSWEETQNLKPMTTSFNITVRLVGETDKRDLANDIPLIVIKNKNPVPKEE